MYFHGLMDLNKYRLDSPRLLSISRIADSEGRSEIQHFITNSILLIFQQSSILETAASCMK